MTDIAGPDRGPIRFYLRRDPYGEFSNFSRHPIEVWGSAFSTSEHFFQAMKFATTDPAYARRIMTAATPAEAARLGRDRDYPLRPDWEEIKDDVMRLAVLCKVEQHQAIKDLLLGTGTRTLIEATTDDHYWGEGSSGEGQNMLGVVLEEVRLALRRHRTMQIHARLLYRLVGDIINVVTPIPNVD